MSNSMFQKLAKESGKTLTEVQAEWQACKVVVRKTGLSEQSPRFFRQVSELLMQKLIPSQPEPETPGEEVPVSKAKGRRKK